MIQTFSYVLSTISDRNIKKGLNLSQECLFIATVGSSFSTRFTTESGSGAFLAFPNLCNVATLVASDNRLPSNQTSPQSLPESQLQQHHTPAGSFGTLRPNSPPVPIAISIWERCILGVVAAAFYILIRPSRKGKGSTSAVF